MRWNQSMDPLGIDLRQRAQERQTAFELENPTARLRTVPHDPQWDAYFQAMDDAGVNRLADNSVGAAKGMWSGSEPLPNTYNPTFQQSALNGQSEDTHLSAPASVSGLYAATGGGPGSTGFGMFQETQTPQGKGRRFMKIRNQRGSYGMNRSERE